MRLIDADALIESFEKMHGGCWTEHVRNFAKYTVIAQPTVDAVPVIRCKDCRHWVRDQMLCSHEKTRDGDICCLECDAEHYCGYAERREP